MRFANPGSEEICALLERVKTIAVVGYSPRPGRPSHTIAGRMQQFGFRVIPVRPGIGEGLGEKAYRDLASVPDRIDLVNVFRASQYVSAVVDECLRLGLKNIWIQDGIRDETAAARARAAGMTVVMDRCIMRDYASLCRG